MCTTHYLYMNVVPIGKQLCTDTTCLHGGSCGIIGCDCAENWWGDRCEKGKFNFRVDIQKCPISVCLMLVCSMQIYFTLFCFMLVCSKLMCSMLVCLVLVCLMLVCLMVVCSLLQNYGYNIRN